METIHVGDEFTIRISIRNAQNVYGLSANLIFPKDALEILRENDVLVYTAGEFLGDESVLMVNLGQDEATGKGSVEIMHSLRGAQPEKDGEGTLLSIRARALKAGRHALQWHANSTVINAQQVVQPNVFEETEMTISTKELAQQVNTIYIEIEQP